MRLYLLTVGFHRFHLLPYFASYSNYTIRHLHLANISPKLGRTIISTNLQHNGCLIVTLVKSFSQHPNHSWLSPWLSQKLAIRRESPLMTERRWMEAEASGGGEGVSGGCSFIFTSLSAWPHILISWKLTPEEWRVGGCRSSWSSFCPLLLLIAHILSGVRSSEGLSALLGAAMAGLTSAPLAHHS